MKINNIDKEVERLRDLEHCGSYEEDNCDCCYDDLDCFVACPVCGGMFDGTNNCYNCDRDAARLNVIAKLVNEHDVTPEVAELNINEYIALTGDKELVDFPYPFPFPEIEDDDWDFIAGCLK